MLIRFAHNGRINAKRSTKEQITTVTNPARKQQVLSDIMAGRAVKKEYDRVLESEPKVVFAINDLKQGGDKYIHYMLQLATDEEIGEGEKRKSVVYLFHRTGKHVDPKDVIKEAKKLCKRIGNPPVVLMSELKAKYSPLIDKFKNDNPRIPRERRTIVEMKRDLYRARRQRGKGWQDAWDKSEEQPDGPKFYVALERLRAIESGFDRAYDLVEFVNTVGAAGVFGIDSQTKIYGLRKNSKLRQEADWIDLIPYVKKMVPQVMSPEREMQLSYLLSPFTCDHSSLLASIADKKLLYAKSPLQKFANQLALAKKSENEAADSAMTKILRRAENTWGIYKVGNTVTFDAAWKELLKVYPLLYLQWYGGSGRNQKDALIVDYLLMIDATNGITAPAPKAVAAAAGADGIAPVETISETEVSNG